MHIVTTVVSGLETPLETLESFESLEGVKVSGATRRVVLWLIRGIFCLLSGETLLSFDNYGFEALRFDFTANIVLFLKFFDIFCPVHSRVKRTFLDLFFLLIYVSLDDCGCFAINQLVNQLKILSRLSHACASLVVVPFLRLYRFVTNLGRTLVELGDSASM